MRNNQPVTNREYALKGDDFLISRTNRRGRITYANPAFIEVSGFTREELIGAPHNIVRHPDMPEQAFENLWSTLKDGGTWIGLVKNRRKDGGYYWVRAHVTPIIEDGEIAGFVSVRLKADKGSIDAAEQAYTALREGRGGHLYLHRGEIRRRGVVAALRRWNPRSVSSRMTLLYLASAAPLLGAGVIGFLGRGEAAPLSTALMALAAVGLPLLALLFWATARSVLGPVREAGMFTLQIAAGNLAAKPPRRLSGEMGLLVMGLKLMRRSLGSIVGDVNRGIEVVTPAARDIAQGNEDLSSRSEQQAASLQQTASSMEEITATVGQNAENARQASRLSSEASRAVSESGEVMGQVVDTMGRITASSEKMAVIIGTIDSIAFQTNILALNASVEAARAGEHGRGFAVVAQEVRTLAGRSGDASREIRELVDRSVTSTQTGAGLVKNAGRTMEDIVASIDKVTRVISEISTGAQEQSQGIGQVNTAVAELDTMTQHNASMVEETSSAAEEMRHQAEQLAALIASFRLSGQTDDHGGERVPVLRAVAADRYDPEGRAA